MYRIKKTYSLIISFLILFDITFYSISLAEEVSRPKLSEKSEKSSKIPSGISNYPHGFGIGPSCAYTMNYNYNKDRGVSVNTDISYTIFFVTPSLNLKYLNLKKKSYYGMQFELCIYIPYIGNIGGGAGYLWGYKNAPIYHLFYGFPIPLILYDRNGDPIYKKANIKPFNLISMEPFFRINYFNRQTYHEFGIMIKFNTINIAGIVGP